MGLLTGDTPASLAVAVAIFLLLVDLMHRRRCWAPLRGNLLQMDFQNTLCYFDQVTKVGGWQQRSWGPHLAADSGWWVKPQGCARRWAEKRQVCRANCGRAFVQGLKDTLGFPNKGQREQRPGVECGLDSGFEIQLHST